MTPDSSEKKLLHSFFSDGLLARSDDARALLRQIFNNEADLVPDLATKTLTVKVHHLAQAAHDQAIEQLCATLNATQTIFPGTELTLVFKVGSS